MIKVRHILENDFKEWNLLFKGYADFYKVKINDDIIDNVWSWLHDSKHELKALVIEKNQQIVAFAHYRRMPSALRGKDIGFLDDLFVCTKRNKDENCSNFENAVEERNYSRVCSSVWTNQL